MQRKIKFEAKRPTYTGKYENIVHNCSIQSAHYITNTINFHCDDEWCFFKITNIFKFFCTRFRNNLEIYKKIFRYFGTIKKKSKYRQHYKRFVMINWQVLIGNNIMFTMYSLVNSFSILANLLSSHDSWNAVNIGSADESAIRDGLASALYSFTRHIEYRSESVFDADMHLSHPHL